MQLNLTKPLVVFDLETTGINIVTDRIIEIALLKVNADNTSQTYTTRINPGMPIPPASTFIHGITDEDVKDSPSFAKAAPEIAAFIGSADLAGYNSNKFDVPFLFEEFARAGVEFSLQNRKLIDVKNIFYKMEPRTLSAAYKFYCNKDLIDAHSALADTTATFEILKAQIERYEQVAYEEKKGQLTYPVKNDMQALHDFTNLQHSADISGHIVFNDKQQEIFNFGKYKGQVVEQVFSKEPQYYDWMMKADFPAFTKQLIQTIYLRRLNNGNISITTK